MACAIHDKRHPKRKDGPVPPEDVVVAKVRSSVPPVGSLRAERPDLFCRHGLYGADLPSEMRGNCCWCRGVPCEEEL